MLEGTSRIYKHPKARTLYITIPATIARDSLFPFKAGDLVTVEWHVSGFLTIMKKSNERVCSAICPAKHIDGDSGRCRLERTQRFS